MAKRNVAAGDIREITRQITALYHGQSLRREGCTHVVPPARLERMWVSRCPRILRGLSQLQSSSIEVQCKFALHQVDCPVALQDSSSQPSLRDEFLLRQLWCSLLRNSCSGFTATVRGGGGLTRVGPIRSGSCACALKSSSSLAGESCWRRLPAAAAYLFGIGYSIRDSCEGLPRKTSR